MNPYYKTDFYSKWNKVSSCIIVSTGRTGTMFFEDFFNTNFKNVKCLHEPHPDLFSLGTTSIRKKWSSTKVKRNLKYSRYSIYKELKKNDFKTYIESNNNIVLLLKDYLKVFPNTKVLHIVREPSSYIMSAYSKKHGKTQYALFDEKDPRPRLAATDYENDSLFNEWNQLGRFEKIAWFWKKYNQLIEENAPSKNYKLIKYENVFSENTRKTAINEIISFFNLKDTQIVSDDKLLEKLKERKNHSPNYSIKAPSEWNNSQKEFFKKHIAEEALKYGYKLPF